MTVLRRLLMTFAVMFWLGGFTFYAAVVVPIGTAVLGGPAVQGDITQRVTTWLNLAGGVALAFWAWDLAADPAPGRLRQVGRWLLWTFLAATLLMLFWWHPLMVALRDAPEYSRETQRSFRRLHRLYLWTSTFQWGAALVLILSTIRTWRQNDRRSPISHLQSAAPHE